MRLTGIEKGLGDIGNRAKAEVTPSGETFRLHLAKGERTKPPEGWGSLTEYQ